MNWLEREWSSVYSLPVVDYIIPQSILTQLTTKDHVFYNHVLITTLLSFTLHAIVYYGRFLPFLLCDYMPSMQKYKVQPTKQIDSAMLIKCMKALLFSQFCVQLPLQLGFHPMAEWLGMRTYQVPFPTVSVMIIQVVLFMLFEDAYHYWMHRALHYGPFYKYIHKQHHEFQSPFGIAAEYAHPIETVLLGVGTIGGPLLYVAATGNLHLITVFVWLTVRLLQTVDAHSGYDFPVSFRNWMPFWAGADFHDHHHMVFLGNYSSSFRFWDWTCGTDKRYNAWKQKQASIHESKKVK